MARMFNPPHPGLTLRDDVLPALGLTVTQAAQQLGVSRVTLSRVLNGRAAVSPEMALREEGLQLRLRLPAQAAAPLRGKLRLPVFKGRGGLVAGVDPLSNKALLAAPWRAPRQL